MQGFFPAHLDGGTLVILAGNNPHPLWHLDVVMGYIAHIERFRVAT
jgi:hypothetical protein